MQQWFNYLNRRNAVELPGVARALALVGPYLIWFGDNLTDERWRTTRIFVGLALCGLAVYEAGKDGERRVAAASQVAAFFVTFALFRWLQDRFEAPWYVDVLALVLGALLVFTLVSAAFDVAYGRFGGREVEAEREQTPTETGQRKEDS